MRFQLAATNPKAPSTAVFRPRIYNGRHASSRLQATPTFDVQERCSVFRPALRRSPNFNS